MSIVRIHDHDLEQKNSLPKTEREYRLYAISAQGHFTTKFGFSIVTVVFGATE